MYLSIPKKIDEVTRPVKKGELYMVPCIVKEEGGNLYVNPVINHPHNDRENGQDSVHYHVDYRFIKYRGGKEDPLPLLNHSRHLFAIQPRPQIGRDGKLEYIALPVINEEFAGGTAVELIKNSKLKHDCIYKGKCPHRGYDLSQVSPENGIITCPLHGLKFDELTKKII